MLRKLFSIAFVVIATNSFAQVSITPIKTTENTGDAQIDYKQIGAPMPKLRLLLVHDSASTTKITEKEKPRKSRKKMKEQDEARTGGYVTDADLNKANLFVMMFNPTCSHCQNETQMLEKNISMFKKSQLILLAKAEMAPYLPEFIKGNNTDNFPGTIYLGIDSSKFIDNVFLYQQLPQINVYSSQRKLLKVYKGDVPIDSLEKYIQ